MCLLTLFSHQLPDKAPPGVEDFFSTIFAETWQQRLPGFSRMFEKGSSTPGRARSGS